MKFIASAGIKDVNRVPYLVAAICFVAWLVLYNLSYDVAFQSRWILQFTAGGISFWKGTFFLAWTSVCLAALSYNSRPRRNISPRRFWLLVLAPLFLNLAAHCWYSWQQDLALNQRTFSFYQGLVSTNSIFHTHILKGTLCLLLDLMNISAHEIAGDAGLPFYHLVPRAISILALICFLLSGWTLLQKMLAVEPTLPKHNKFAWISCFIAASYNVLKAGLDGGLLSVEAVVYLSVLFTLTTGISCRESTKEFGRVVILGALTITAIFYRRLPDPAWWYVRDVSMLASFGIGLYCIFYQGRARVILTGVVALGVSLLAAREHYFSWDRQYLSRVIQPPQEAILTLFRDEQLPFPIIAEEGGVRVHRVAPIMPTTVKSLVAPLGIVPGHRPLQVVGDHCLEDFSTVLHGDLRGAPLGPLSPTTTSPLVTRLTLRAIRPGLYSYTSIINQCWAGDTPLVLGRKISELGFESFILTASSVNSARTARRNH